MILVPWPMALLAGRLVFMARRSSGFSLSELMVAFLILSVVAVLLLGVVPGTIIGLHKASQRTNAAIIAANEMEQLRRLGFGEIVTSAPPFPEKVVEQTVYTVRVEVEPAAMSDGTLMEDEVAKRIRVIVNWDDQRETKEHSTCAVVFRRI